MGECGDAFEGVARLDNSWPIHSNRLEISMARKSSPSFKPKLIGIIFLPPLPGSPGASHLFPSEALQEAGARAVAEAKLLTRNGFEGIILQNEGDGPFLTSQAAAETIAAFSIILAAVREVTPIPLGVHLRKSDPLAALAIASVARANFIVSPAGYGALLARERIRLNASSVFILTQLLYSQLKNEEWMKEEGVEGLILREEGGGEISSQKMKKMNFPLFFEGPLSEPSSQGRILGRELREKGDSSLTINLKKMRTEVKFLKPKLRKVKIKKIKKNKAKNGENRISSP